MVGPLGSSCTACVRKRERGWVGATFGGGGKVHKVVMSVAVEVVTEVGIGCSRA